MSQLLIGPLGKIVLLSGLYLLLAVVVWMEARELAHATTHRPSQVAPQKGGRRNPSRLVLLEGTGPKEVTLAAPETLLGRDAAAHVRIPDPAVSGRHARVYHADGEWYLEDLGSRNGTFMNDRELTHPVVLRIGDRVAIGRSVLEARG